MNEPHLLDALAALGPDWRPRTRHLEADGRPRFTNRLVKEQSPYLLQHAHNPVDWRPWGEEAFAEARRRDVPVFLSVGYSTCHWCHVMEHESFEDLEVAAFLNEHFVPVKVDREERPDVDAVHMEFLQLTTGGGGWPMSVWLTAEGRPLYAGTYFPARDGDRGRQPGFLSLLRVLSERWRDPALQAQAEPVLEHLKAEPEPATEIPGVEPLERSAAVFLRLFDETWGGFGGAPKFPRPCVLDHLLRECRRTGKPGPRRAVETTLVRMACGGIYDHVGGGFARYSVDNRWLVPHFEKMLYDNAQLASAYVEAWQASGRPLFRRVAEDVLAWLDREMSDPEGGFHSATDADSPDGEGGQHEGLFFTWTPTELRAALDPEDAGWVASTFGVEPGGNFEGRSVLHLQQPLEGESLARWERLRWRLHEIRAERPPPGLDDKVLVSWNALAISAFARASLAFSEPRYAARAARAAAFVFDRMRDDAGLFRAWRKGRPRHRGVLEDHAALLCATLDLLEATGEVRWLDESLWLARALERFAAPGGGFYRTPSDGQALLFRERPLYDGAEPSGSSYAALGLLRLSEVTGEDAWARAAAGVLRSAGEILERGPHASPKLLCALDLWHARRYQVALVTPAGRPDAMLAAIGAGFAPHAMVLFGEEGGRLAGRLPLFAERPAEGGATAYVCRGVTCDLPRTSPEEVAARLTGPG